MWYLAVIPFILQAIAILIDEFYFHHERGLPKWERIGHPIDTLSLWLCFALILWLPYNTQNLAIYIGCAIFSCFLVTKDEFIHKEHCPGAENWLHAVLFILHPIVLIIAGIIWPFLTELPWIHLFLQLQTGVIFLYFCYQLIYWNFIWKKRPVKKH